MAPIKITFRGMPASPSVEAAVERWVRRLEHVCDRIQHCSVVIDSHRHPHFEVRLGVAVLGQPVIVVGGPGIAARANVYVAVSDAFRAGRRLLIDALHPSREEPSTRVRSAVLDGSPRERAGVAAQSPAVAA